MRGGTCWATWGSEVRWEGEKAGRVGRAIGGLGRGVYIYGTAMEDSAAVSCAVLNVEEPDWVKIDRYTNRERAEVRQRGVRQSRLEPTVYAQDCESSELDCENFSSIDYILPRFSAT